MVSRRAFLAGVGAGVAAALAGCSSGASAASAGTPRPGPVSSAPPTPVPPESPLPTPVAWTAGPGEVNPAVKARATRLLQVAGTFSDGTDQAERLSAAGFQPALAKNLAFLAPSGDAAVTNVVDAQYGGILTATASVLIPVEQWYRGADGSVQKQGRTFDVRLRKASPHWKITEVNPADSGPAVDTLSDLAKAVLANDRIHLPASARADVMAGQIHDTVLQALDTLARKHVLDLSVLRSGHPLLVFGTDRPSDHPHGRAADVWAIDGQRVVDPANRDLVVAFMREAAATGPWQVGGPVDPDGSGPQYFSDNTHHDHVHLGFHT